MKEILSLLYNITDKNECHCGEVSSHINFSINEFQICIITKPIEPNKKNDDIGEIQEDYDNDNDEFRYKQLDSIDEFLSVYPNNYISEISVSLIEYLGSRDDSIIKNNENEGFKVKYNPTSFAKTILNTSREINIRIPELFEGYSFEPYFDDSCYYCEADASYVAKIFIKHNFLNKENATTLIQILKEIKHEELEQIYWSAFFEQENIKNYFEGQFLNTNTKVRRLGYLKIFFKLIKEKKKIPASFINKKYEEFAVRYNHYLVEAVNSKGLIQDSKGKSAAPYLNLLKEFNLIETVNRLVFPSKSLRVYLELANRFNKDENENPFFLTEFDKVFFLELILQKDFLYTSIILELIFLNKNPNINYLVSVFQNAILKRLDNFLKQNTEQFEKRKVAQIKRMKKRIEEWEKPEVYLEHVLMPRINWLADLGLIQLFNDNSILLLPEGKKVLNGLFSWIDINCNFIENAEFYLKRFYPHLAGLAFRSNLGKYPDVQEIQKCIDNYIDESFLLFKTLAPNRVTSSQAFTFTKYSFYFNEKFCVTTNYLERIIQEEFAKKYIFKFQQRYGDGYIQKIKRTS